MVILVFPGISAGKKSACSAVDPGSIPGSVAQLVKKFPPAIQETPVQFLGQEDPLEKG